MLESNVPNLAPFDGELRLHKGFYPVERATQLMDRLSKELVWQEERLLVFGKWVNVPRLMCWYGDREAVYRYSNVVHQPLPWHPCLKNIQADLEAACSVTFNSVLGNLYRDGNDAMGLHADNEPELGERPVIASLSFGASRTMTFKHSTRKQCLKIELEQGDLLLMTGTLQTHWRHALPRTRQPKSARINLTFRKIQSRFGLK